MKQVQPGSFLTLQYRLAGPDGADLVNTFHDKPATLSLGTGELAPAMEARLLGLAEGTHQSFELEPGEARGITELTATVFPSEIDDATADGAMEFGAD